MLQHNAARIIPRLQVKDIHKRFGSTQALRGVDFSLKSREAHALLGENGSGKSTLMKIVCGEYSQDSGTVMLDGSHRSFSSPAEARDAGVAMVAQEVPVLEDLTVAENICLGRSTPKGIINWRKMRSDAAVALDVLGAHLDPDTRVFELKPSERQLVTIARAVNLNARVLVFDEPTSSLNAEQAELLF